VRVREESIVRVRVESIVRVRKREKLETWSFNWIPLSSLTLLFACRQSLRRHFFLSTIFASTFRIRHPLRSTFVFVDISPVDILLVDV
jgi:hypothetical protein